MSDAELIARLHSLHKQATVERSHFYVGWCAMDAIHRIEELEAKLAKAVDMLRILGIADAILAELKGQDDE